MLALVGVSAAVILFRRLGASDLRNWDEATYAQVAKEIVQGGGWLTFHYEWQPWLEKPPLFLWAVASSFSVFGISETSARAVAATAALALVFVVFSIAELQYDRMVACVAVAILLSTLLFVQSARAVMLDTPLTLLLYLSMYAYLRADRGSPRWWYVAGVSVACAVLLKGAAAIVGPAAIGLAAVLDGRASGVMRSRQVWGAAGLALLLTIPWHVLMYHRHGQVFLDVYLRHHTVNRVTEAIVANSGGPWFYFQQLMERGAPWSYLFPAAVLFAVANPGHRQRSHVLLSFVAVVFGLYSVAQTRLWWYIVPTAPALAILTGGMLAAAWRFPAGSRFGVQGWRGQLHRGIIAILFLTLVSVGLQRIRLLQRPLSLSEAVLGRVARSSGPADRDLIIAYREVPTPTLLYYSDRPVREMWSAAGLPGLLAEGCRRRIVFLREDLSALAADYDVRVLARHRTYAYGTIAARSSETAAMPCPTR